MKITDNNSLYFVKTEKNVIIKITERCNFRYAITLKHYLKEYLDQSLMIILDMSCCTYMDSTILGLVASFSNQHQKLFRKKIQVYNLQEFVSNLFSVLGIKMLIEVINDLEYDKDSLQQIKEISFEPETGKNIIYHSHKFLSSIDKENKNRFEDVLKQLDKN